MKMNTARNVLIFLLAFLGLGAVGGGAMFIVSPSGALFGMPLSMLENSPFNNFLLPGIILFLILGVAPLLLIIPLRTKPTSKLAQGINFFRDMHWAWSYTIYIAFALIIWIQIQMVIIGGVHFLHTFYIFFALIILFVALLPSVRNIYKNQLVT
ncbi:hypothetical protein MASR2M41_02350 [Flammeovirgaceae bacterium]